MIINNRIIDPTSIILKKAVHYKIIKKSLQLNNLNRLNENYSILVSAAFQQIPVATTDTGQNAGTLQRRRLVQSI